MGVASRGRSQLAPRDNDFAYARLFALWRCTRWPPFHECSVAYRRNDSLVSRALVNDRRALRSALVAAVFAIHPLHVESVAWIAERKEVLSGVFFMLAIGLYAHYVRQSIRSIDNQQAARRKSSLLHPYHGGLRGNGSESAPKHQSDKNNVSGSARCERVRGRDDLYSSNALAE